MSHPSVIPDETLQGYPGISRGNVELLRQFDISQPVQNIERKTGELSDAADVQTVQCPSRVEWERDDEIE